jgi:hypothetical protein
MLAGMVSSVVRLIVATAVAAALSSPAAAQTQTKAKPPPAKAQPANPPAASQPMPPPDPPSSPENRMKTSEQVKKGSVEGAVTTPLRDLNVVKVDIPDVLMEALEDPYARPRNGRCPTLTALIRPLNDVLGPDIDTIPGDEEGWGSRGKSTALGVAGDLAGGAIPVRGVVRKLSGAESHDRLVTAAIIAGHARRAYLKGLGEARGCGPPATPSHERTGLREAIAAHAAEVEAREKAGLKPKYPTKPSAGAPKTNAGKTQAAPPPPRS